MSTTTPTNIFGYTYKHYCEKPINKKVLNTYPICNGTSRSYGRQHHKPTDGVRKRW